MMQTENIPLGQKVLLDRINPGFRVLWAGALIDDEDPSGR